jgi:hypothetical protein
MTSQQLQEFARVGAEARLRAAINENGWSDWAELTAIYPNRGFTGGNNVIIRKAMESADPPEYFGSGPTVFRSRLLPWSIRVAACEGRNRSCRRVP